MVCAMGLLVVEVDHWMEFKPQLNCIVMYVMSIEYSWPITLARYYLHTGNPPSLFRIHTAEMGHVMPIFQT